MSGATENNGVVPSFRTASGSVPAYRVITMGASARVSVHVTNTALILGVSTIDASATNDAIGVVLNGGTARCMCGASVSVGSIVTAQTDTGKVIGATITDDTTTSVVPKTLGIALQSGSTNAVIDVALIINNLNKQASA